MGRGMDGMMGTPAMVLGWIVVLLVVAVLTAALVWLVRGIAGDGRTPPQRGAIEQLEMRYARGEIDRDEYLQRRDDLERR